MTETFHAGTGLGRLSDVTIIHGDCLEAMAELAADSVDAIVTDPPYGLEFMGKEWDGADGFRRSLNANDVGRDNAFGRASRTSPEYRAGHLFQQWCELWTVEAFRVLKPGGHLLAFGGTRTWHRLAVAVEDAGFEIRDSIAWLYGSGFPKSLDVSKAIDKMDATDARRSRALRFTEWMRSTGVTSRQIDEATGTNMGGHYLTASSQPQVATLAHLDTLRSLLPGVPQWVEEMAQERTVESENFKARAVTASRSDGAGNGSVVGLGSGRSMATEFDETAAHTPEAAQWSGWGTALKPAFEPVVVARKPLVGTVAANVLAHGTGALNIDGCRIGTEPITSSGWTGMDARRHAHGTRPTDYGGGTREPSTHAGRWPANVVLDADQAAALDQMSGISKSTGGRTANISKTSTIYGGGKGLGQELSADAVRGDPGFGDTGGASRFFYVPKAPKKERPVVDGVTHPTVKPIALMRWLVRLVTPPGGVVLDPFAGSGTTVEAALLEDFRVIGIEREADYLPMIQQRIARCLNS